jgi:uncharacterized protein DUF6969
VNRRDSEIEAAAILRDCRHALAVRGSTVAAEVTGAAAAAEWRHYPDGEVYDPDTHSQYFFHRHPEPAGTGFASAAEPGHFHLFLRGDGMPAGVTPLLLPEIAIANAPLPPQSAPARRGDRDEVCHLVAVALDRRGEPVRLFTTNRWVTGETWYSADDMVAMLGRFRVQGDRPSALVNHWLGALVRLFERDIAELLRARDKAVRERRWRWRSNVLEDPRLEIASSLDIDLDARLAALAQASGDGSAPIAAKRAPLLPRMAEGWGV